jgi:type IV secretion system protein VirD4
MVNTIGPAFQTIAPGLVMSDWLIGLAGAIIIRLVVYYKIKNTKKFRKDMEYGSARWGTALPVNPVFNLYLLKPQGISDLLSC